VTAQGLFAGIQNGRQFVSISSILVAASKILATDLSVTFVPARDLDIKSMRLVDAGLSIPCMRATGFIIYAEGRKYGTGFLCKWKGKRFVITNYHVLGLLKDAQEAWIEFRALNPVLRVKLDPSKVHLADQVLDFAVIAISESSLRDLKFVEPLELSLEESIEAVALQVLGYPSGQALLRKSVGSTIDVSADDIADFMRIKQISISPERFHKTFIAYDAETESGSSGSGIISKSGREVLGLHHSQIIGSITRFGTRSAAILHKLDELADSLPQDYDNDTEKVAATQVKDAVEVMRSVQAIIPNFDDRRREGADGYFEGTRLQELDMIRSWLNGTIENLVYFLWNTVLFTTLLSNSP
jgi:hypothetical protein